MIGPSAQAPGHGHDQQQRAPGDHRAVGLLGDLSRNEYQIAGAHIGHVIGDGRRLPRKPA